MRRVCKFGWCANTLPKPAGKGRPAIICTECHERLSPLVGKASGKDGRLSVVKSVNTMWHRCRFRSEEKGREFTITEQDIYDIWPESNTCPILGIRFERGEWDGNKDTSASLDRIDSTKGYIPGNISIISGRANRIKNDATLEEIEKLYLWTKTI